MDMVQKEGLQDRYKTCPQCGKTLPIAHFITEDRGDDHYPILATLCADCRQRNLNDNTRRDFHEQLDLDHRDLWLRGQRQKEYHQQKQDQAEEEQALEEEEQARDKASWDDTDKKGKSRERDKQNTKSKSFLNNPLFYETTDLDTSKTSRQKNELHDSYTQSGENIDYDYYFLSHYSPDRLSFKNRQLNIAKTGINLSYIDPEILTRLFYENPFYERLRDFIDSTAGIEHTAPFALSRVRAIHLGAPATYAVSSPNFYAMQINVAPAALYNSNNEPTQKPANQIGKTASSGLFASTLNTNEPLKSTATHKAHQYATNNIFQDSQNTMQPEESDELTEYIRKTWGKP